MTDKTATVESPTETGPVTEELMQALRDAWNTPPTPYTGSNLWQFAAVNRYLREHRKELGLGEQWLGVEYSERFTMTADQPTRYAHTRYIADLFALAPGLVLIAHPGAMPYQAQSSYNGVFECFNGLVVRGRNSDGEIVYWVSVFYPYPGWDWEGGCGAWIGGVPVSKLPQGAAGQVYCQFYCGDSGVELTYYLGPANWLALTAWLDQHLAVPAS